MIRKLATLFALIAVTLAGPASAYWEYGHETVAAIAYRNVKPDTRVRIDRLLRQSALLETPGCPARTIEQASVWADCIKELGPRFSYAYSWHYQNVNVCQPFALKPACKDGNCVSAQIERDVKLLKDPKLPLRERLQALAFLVHFVGDLHQPLHAGDRGDLGGNQVLATYGSFSSEKFNLHSVWDGYLADRAITTPPALPHPYSPAEKAAMQAGTVEDWSRESWEVSRDVAYANAMGGDPCAKKEGRVVIDQAMIEKMIPAAKLEVERGGLRLARLLDESLG